MLKFIAYKHIKLRDIMTRQLYLADTYLLETPSSIINYGVDERGQYVLLQETVFYPQGGGQPSDQGVLKTPDYEAKILSVRQFDQEIRHYIDDTKNVSSLNNQVVQCIVDQPRRMLNARYHTAAHLLDNVVESMLSDLKGVKGHSFPGEAYVEYIGNSIPDLEELTVKMNAAVAENLTITTFEMLPEEFATKYYVLPYPVPAHKSFRVVQIGNYTPVPCGGTHVKSTAEIGKVSIRKISKKSDRLKISYDLSM